MVHPKPFLTLHLDTSKDIATERGDALSGTQLYHRANFQADWHHHRRHICLTTKNGLTADDIYPTNRILALRLSHKNRDFRPITHFGMTGFECCQQISTVEYVDDTKSVGLVNVQ